MSNECKNCYANESKQLFSLNDYIIKKCNNCSIIYNSNFPPQKNIENSFSDHYYKTVQSEAFKDDFIDNTKDPSYEIYTNTLVKIDNLNKNGGRKLLEIGYGRGTFLKTAIQNNWEVEGVDISKDAFKYVRKNITKNVQCGEFIKLYDNKEKFDSIFFWDSIEHINYPAKYFIKANSLLIKSGTLVITTDRYDSFVGFLSAILYYISFGLFKYPVRRTFIPYNSFYFTKNSIKKLLIQSGFKIIEIKGIDYPISKINLNFFEKTILRTIYILGKITRLESQLYIIAKKI